MNKIPSGFETSDSGYTLETLDADITSWVSISQANDEKKLNDPEAPDDYREYIRAEIERTKNMKPLDLFLRYQNNFTVSVLGSCKHLLPDGSPILADGDNSGNKHLGEVEHWFEIREAINVLGYDVEEVSLAINELNALGKKADDRRKEMLRNIWIEMRKKGFTRLELIG